jgi:Recombinase
MQARLWTTKRWRTRDGHEHLGRSFTKPTLLRLLRNVVYLGRVSHEGAVYAGEQETIVEPAVWERVQEELAKEQKGCGVVVGSSASSKKNGNHRTSPTVVSEPTERVPRITRLLALAQKFEELIGSGVVNNYAALAQVGRVSRSRVTQMTSLLNLAPDIQEEILFLGVEEAAQFRISEPSLRKLTATLLWNQQREQWKNLRRLAIRSEKA